MLRLELPAVGDAILVAISFALAAAELHLYRRRPLPQHFWTAMILIAVGFFAAFMGVHYHVSDEHAPLMTRLEGTALTFVLHGWVVLASVRSRVPIPVRKEMIAASLVVFLGVLWVPTSFEAVQHHRILLLDHPLPRRVDDAMQTVSLVYAFFLAMLGIVWLRRHARKRAVWPARGMAVWAGCAIVDAVTAGFMIPVPILILEYGALFFAMSLVADGLSEYVELLTAQQRDFRELIEQTPDVVAVLRDDAISFANPALVRALGGVEVEGRPVKDALGLGSVPRAGDRMQGSVRLPNGNEICLELVALEMEFDLEPVVVLVGQDVTERVELMTQAMMLDRAATAGTVAAGVGHEINNPLAFVSTTLEEISLAVDGGGRPTELAGHVETALGGLRRVARIVEGLGTFSPLRPVRAVDSAGVVHSAVTIASEQTRRAARVVVELEQDLPPVDADATRLGQVLINLLVNAAQAIGFDDPETQEIRIAARRDGGSVVFEVSDTGPGIDPDVLPRIFDLFFTTKMEGTGLGLAISRESLRSMGGSLRAFPREGGGTVFRASVPQSASPLRVSALPETPDERVEGCVLIVDDEPELARSLARLLRRQASEIQTASSGREAVAILESIQVDLVVTDLLMPNMTGMELHAWAEKERPDLAGSMVFVTGGAFTPAARDFVTRFPERVLSKPLDTRELRARVVEGLRLARGPSDDHVEPVP